MASTGVRILSKRVELGDSLKHSRYKLNNEDNIVDLEELRKLDKRRKRKGLKKVA